MERARPIVIAYDGSPVAAEAMRRAGELFASWAALVLTVWEPGLGELMLLPDPTGMGTTMLPYDPAVAKEIDEEVKDEAHAIVRNGVELATSVGLSPRELLVRDEIDVVEAIVQAATHHEAAAIVIGSTSVGRLRARLLGGTAAGVLKHAPCPVLVVRHAEERSPEARGGAQRTG
jgi:nucleotide-binding universal stress UspA family protein